MASVSFGNRRAGILAYLKQRQRLDLVAEGLPIIAASAQGFWEASQKLEKGSREATVLEGFAEEEAAKALILVDLIRCPPKQVARRAAAMIKTRSEERRVGKECVRRVDLGGRRIIKKKKLTEKTTTTISKKNRET